MIVQLVNPDGYPSYSGHQANPKVDVLIAAGHFAVAVPLPDGRWRWTGAEWVAAPPAVPQSVTPLQARKALIAAGILGTVETWIQDQSEDVRVAWEYASIVERDDPVIAAAATALDMTDAEVDALFIAAAQI
jgi:hypothetical protein